MKKTLFAFLFLLVALASVFAQPETTESSIKEKSGEINLAEPKLIWSDEFDGTGMPDPAKWDRPEYNRRPNSKGPDGWWSKEDSFLDGKGNLVIRVRKIDDKNADGDPYDYSVGVVRTLGKFSQKYGRFEARCQLPKQQGWWVAFWMMQGNVSSEANAGVDGSEVDIMEGFGWTNKINHAVHYDGYGAAHKSVERNELISGIREGFHTYTLEWYPEKYVFFVDGKEMWRTSGGGVCNQPGYIKLTGEISTESWAIANYWANDPAKATYPDSFKVDYVRVYEIGAYVPPASINSINQNQNIKLYPNPADESLTVSWPEYLATDKKMDIQIINSSGQVVKSLNSFSQLSAIPIGDLKKGLYLMQVRTNERSFSQKFFKT